VLIYYSPNLREQMNFLSREKTWMPSDNGIQDIVFPMGESQISKEVDCLIASKDYIFLLEVKDWKGHITQKNGVFYQGDREIKSPEKQTHSKVKLIEELLARADTKHHRTDHGCKVVPVYVFTHKEAVLDPNLPHHYVRLDALPAFMSHYRDRMTTGGKLQLKQVKDALYARMDQKPSAKYKHILRIAMYGDNPSEDVLEFKSLHEKSIKLETAIKAIKSGPKEMLKNGAMFAFVAAVIIALLWYWKYGDVAAILAALK